MRRETAMAEHASKPGDDADDALRSNRARDPLTGVPGSHPVGTALGAVAGGVAAGAAIGTTAVGPLGTIVGAAVGALVGAAAGKTIAELIDPVAEERYWREHFRDQPYVDADASFDDYGPAYRYGVDAFARHAPRAFEEAEAELSRGWPDACASSSLDWEHARPAVRDSWQRVRFAVEQAQTGDGRADSK
jgi:hypothetical protein